MANEKPEVPVDGGNNASENPPELFSTVGAHANQVSGKDEEDDVKVVDEIESLCMNCEKNGITKLLLTKIPFFKEIILMSFACDHCHFQNTEVQSAGEIQPMGVKYQFRVNTTEDLQRQLVKSDTAVFRVEEADLEIPAGRGKLTNVEGMLTEVKDDLESGQELRKKEHPELYEKLQACISKLDDMVSGKQFPFTITLDDIAGNSTIEPSPRDGSGKYSKKEYKRNPDQNAALGLADATALPTMAHPAGAEGEAGDQGGVEDLEIIEGQRYTLPCECPGCTKPAAMHMQMVNIPYFKQVIITSVACSYCGYKTNEVKTGGEIPPQGRRIWLTVKDAKDMSRDILKAETCMLKIPECSVEVQPGTMGGRFTTVEGLLTQMRDDLRSSIFESKDDAGGDSLPENQKSAWDTFFEKLDRAIRAEFEYEILLEDPLANSYVQSFTAPEPDPQIRTEDYDRTEEEEEELGLKDMKTHLNEQGEYVKEPVVQPDPEIEAEKAAAENLVKSVAGDEATKPKE